MLLIFYLFFQIDSFQIINYQGNQIIYALDSERVFIYDSARIDYGNIVLEADTVIYNLKNNTLEAYPHPVLSQNKDTIYGTYLRYNIKNKKAMMQNGKSRIEKGFFYGEKVFWVEEQTFNVEHGRYTTCDESIPHYYFYSPKMKVFLNDMVIAEPIFLTVRGIPLVFAPFWFVPIARERKSGLLPFKVGRSSTEGKYIKQFAYYWVVNDHSDLTFMIDAMEKKGIKPQIEGVWAYKPHTAGNFSASYIKETDTKIKRYAVQGRSSSERFFFGTTMSANLDFASDKYYIPDYSVERELWLKKEATSNISISRQLPFGCHSIHAYRQQDFEADKIDERLPYYTITTTPYSLFGIISSNINGTAVRQRTTWQDTVSEYSALGVNSSPSLSRNLFGLFTITPGKTLDYELFNTDRIGNRWPGRFAWSFSTGISSNLYRVFAFEGLNLHSILHKITPSMTYHYTPDYDFSRFYQVAGIASYSYINNIDFGISNEFEAKIGEQKTKNRLFGLNLMSGYNLKTDSLNPVGLSFDTRYNFFPPPCTSFALRIGASLYPYTYEYTYNIDNSFQIKIRDLSLTIGQTYVRDGDYVVTGQLSFKPTPKWSVALATSYNVTKNEIASRSLSLARDLHCWEGIFNF
ncbi:MAG: putative LPS assembly protein LptD, partial [candidate division WOR-3 bacterium]